MLTVMRQRNFALLWFGGLISFIGDWITLVALPIYAYTLTGSVLATGAVWIAATLPRVVLGSLAGVYVDRWDRRLTMLAANLLLAPFTLSLLFVQNADQLWILYVATFLKSTVGNFIGPAENALLPKLVAGEYLATANALNTLNNNLARLIGPAIAGVVMSYGGFTYAVLLDAASFLVAAVLIGLIRAPRSVTRATVEGPEGVAEEAARPTRVWTEWLEGLRLVRHNTLILFLFVFAGIAMISEGFFEVLIAPYVADTLRGGAQELGWMMTAQAVGGLLGGLLIGRVSRRVKPVYFLGPGLIALGLIDITIFNIPVLAVDLLLFVLAGPAVVGLHTGTQTLLQTYVEDRYRGRVFATLGTTFSLSVLLGLLIASFVGGATGPTPLMTLGGLLMAGTGLIALVILPRLAAKRTPANETGAGPMEVKKYGGVTPSSGNTQESGSAL